MSERLDELKAMKEKFDAEMAAEMAALEKAETLPAGPTFPSAAQAEAAFAGSALTVVAPAEVAGLTACGTVLGTLGPLTVTGFPAELTLKRAEVPAELVSTDIKLGPTHVGP